MKKTLICIHVMPNEIEQLYRIMLLFRYAMAYLEKTDAVAFKASLNLNPKLTDWDNSELKPDYFIRRFNAAFDGIPNINEIITDESLWGTTQQKREAVKLDYDQFIFCDTDIVFPPKLLKYQLNISYQLNGMYVVSPSLAKWWDESWSVLTHRDFLDKELGYAHSIQANDSAPMQDIDNIEVKQLTGFKFGCGMHTLYSKSFWEIVEIPESFGGYGPEDTYGMAIASWLQQKGYPIKQYVMDGIYIAENIHRKTPSFLGKLVSFDKKTEFYNKAMGIFAEETQKLVEKITAKSNP
jgi:hypothetical protein